MITGATSTDQVDSNLKAAEISLDGEVVERIEELFPA